MGRLSDTAFSGELYLPERTPAQITRRDDPFTSYQAAGGVVHKLRAIQIRVLDELKRAGQMGLTDFDLEERCGSHGSTFRTRRSELTFCQHDVGATLEQFGW